MVKEKHFSGKLPLDFSGFAAYGKKVGVVKSVTVGWFEDCLKLMGYNVVCIKALKDLYIDYLNLEEI